MKTTTLITALLMAAIAYTQAEPQRFTIEQLNELPAFGLDNLTVDQMVISRIVGGWSGIALDNLTVDRIDLTGYKPTGKMLVGAGLMSASGITVEMLEALSDGGLVGTMLPAMDLTGYRPTGEMLTGAHLELTTGLTAETLEKLGPKGLVGTVLPRMDMTGFKGQGRKLTATNFTRTTGLTVEALKGAEDLIHADLRNTGITEEELLAAGSHQHRSKK